MVAGWGGLLDKTDMDEVWVRVCGQVRNMAVRYFEGQFVVEGGNGNWEPIDYLWNGGRHEVD